MSGSSGWKLVAQLHCSALLPGCHDGPVGPITITLLLLCRGKVSLTTKCHRKLPPARNVVCFQQLSGRFNQASCQKFYSSAKTKYHVSSESDCNGRPKSSTKTVPLQHYHQACYFHQALTRLTSFAKAAIFTRLTDDGRVLTLVDVLVTRFFFFFQSSF